MVVKCSLCDFPAWYQDRTSGKMLCLEHSRLEVRGPRPDEEKNRPTLAIRPATPDDEADVLEMWLHFWYETEMECFGRVYQALDCPALLACAGSEIVGLLSYDRESDWDAVNIVALNVYPGYQGQGAAVALLAELEKDALQQGIGRLILATANDNPLALYFYQRQGFVITEVAVNAIRPTGLDEKLVGLAGIPVRDEIRLEKRLIPQLG